jgi:hypothetical protein
MTAPPPRVHASSGLRDHTWWEANTTFSGAERAIRYGLGMDAATYQDRCQVEFLRFQTRNKLTDGLRNGLRRSVWKGQCRRKVRQDHESVVAPQVAALLESHHALSNQPPLGFSTPRGAAPSDALNVTISDLTQRLMTCEQQSGLNASAQSLQDLAQRIGHDGTKDGPKAPSLSSADLRKPFAVSELRKDTELGLGSATPAGQLRTALGRLDSEPRRRVLAAIRLRGKRLVDLDDLCGILTVIYPSKDELVRACERILYQAMLGLPTSPAAFDVWANDLLAAIAALTGGASALPRVFICTMLLVGLANVSGATDPAGLHTALRTQVDGCNFADITEPLALVQHINQFYQSRLSAKVAATTLRRPHDHAASPTKKVKVHTTGVQIEDPYLQDHEDDYHPHAGAASMMRPPLGDPPPHALHALRFDGAKSGEFCGKCGGKHKTADCRGEKQRGVSFEDRIVHLAPNMDASHADAPCQKHSYNGSRPVAHSNSACSHSGTSRAAPRRRPTERARAFLTMAAQFPGTQPPPDLADELHDFAENGSP